MTYQLIQNDILKWTASYTGPKFHALFGDPPYHLTITKRFGKPGSAPAKYGKDGAFSRASRGFMGQAWDGTDEQGKGIAFQPETWAALGEHLHPGGFLMAFAGTRGYHRMACAIEDAGFIIHPALVWTFLSGFPKATRIDTQIDKAAGNTRPDKLNGGHIGMGKAAGDPGNDNELENRVPHVVGKGNHTNGTPIDPIAQTWAGHRYGLQALKPALEFIAVAQKPYEGRPVDCITQTGAGAWNIDGGRIDLQGTENHRTAAAHQGNGASVNPYFTRENQIEREENGENPRYDPAGRWPANLLLSEEGAALLDRQSGELGYSSPTKRNRNTPKFDGIYNGGQPGGDPNQKPSPDGYNDSGGASRMFFQSDWQYEILEQLENADPLRYEPKVSTAEREAGLDELEYKTRNRVNSGGLENDPKFSPTRMKNNHPTLKPISLTKYLAGLLLPPDAYTPRRILCPFSGAGSEMIGAILAGWDEVTGIEKTPAYIPIAEKRLAWWSQWPGWGQTDVNKILASLGDDTPAEQLTLFEA